MKVLLIVLGSLFGLMLIAIVGIAIMIPILGKKMIADSHDPATRARTIAKIATFRVPRGYEIEGATDMGISQSVTIVPAGSAHGAMLIQLSGQHLPTSNPQASLDAMSTGFEITAKLMHCDLARGADDTVAAAGKTVTLRAYGCGSTGAMHVEVGIVSAKASNVQIMATSMHAAFDKAAVDALVASIR